jgi:hypothetical protein
MGSVGCIAAAMRQRGQRPSAANWESGWPHEEQERFSFINPFLAHFSATVAAKFS